MAPIQNIIVVGAGGNVGKPVTEALVAAGFNVTILSRQSSASEFGNLKVIKIADEYPHADLVAAFKGQDAVLSTIAAFHMGGQERLIDAAIEAGVRRFLPSEFGGDNEHEVYRNLVSLTQVRYNVIQYLRSKQDKIEWTAVPTGPFFSWGIEAGFLPFDVKASKAKLIDGGTTKFTSSQLPQIGIWVATLLKHADETANGYFPIESFEVSQLEILHALEKATGKKWEVEHQDGKELISSSQKALAEGNPYALYGIIQGAVFVEGYGNSFHATAVPLMEKFGVKQLDLQTEVDKTVKKILG